MQFLKLFKKRTFTVNKQQEDLMSKRIVSNHVRTGKMMLLSLFLVLGLSLPAMAQGYGTQDQQGGQQEYSPQEQQHQDIPTDFSDEEIDKAANAYMDIIEIREEYHGKLTEVEDPEAAQEIQMEANEKITQAVEENGITVETYNDIITAAQTDEELMNDLLTRIDEIR